MIIDYEIYFKDSNQLKGKIKCAIGQSIFAIGRRIAQIERINYQQYTIEAKENNPTIINIHQKLILRQKNQKFGSIVRSRRGSEDSGSFFQQTSEIFNNQSQYFIEQQPEKPPKVKGRVSQCYKFFSCLTSTKYMSMNIRSLFISNNDGQLVNTTQIPLEDIKLVKSYMKKNQYYIKIITDQPIQLKFVNKDICRQWMNYIIQGVQYSKFIQQKSTYCKGQSLKKFMETLVQFDKQQTNLVTLNDQSSYISNIIHSSRSQQPLYCKQKQKHYIKLEEFNVTHKVGNGAFSVVYRAEKNGKIYALKQLNKLKLLNKNHLKYALTQLNILKKSKDCSFIIPLYYAFQTCDYLYLAIRYTPYGTLKNMLERKIKLQVNIAIQVIVEIIIAIEYLHKKKILYRDLKPDNILIGDNHIYLTDFGLAKELNEDQHSGGSFLGTPLYLAPQRFTQNGGGVDFRADIYGVGCIFYEMLHGKTPYTGQSFYQLAYNIKNYEPQIDNTLEEDVKDFLYKTLHKNPSKRITNMSQHKLFNNINWKKVIKKIDWSINFDVENVQIIQINYQIDRDYDQISFPDKRVRGWNYSQDNNQI